VSQWVSQSVSQSSQAIRYHCTW